MDRVFFSVFFCWSKTLGENFGDVNVWSLLLSSQFASFQYLLSQMILLYNQYQIILSAHKKGGLFFLGIFIVFFWEFFLFPWLAFGLWLLLAFGFCWLVASVGFWLLLAFGFCWLVASVGFWLLLAFGFC